MSQAQPQPPPAIAYAYYQQSAPYDAHASARQGHEDEEKRSIAVQPSVSASAAAAPAPPLLPVGAVPFNGGVLFGPNLFSNSYRVPGPEGRNWVYYDNSCPMPPASTDGPPTLTQQWHQLTRWQKIFVGGLFMFWLLQWLVHPVVALWMPLLFLPTYILWRLWRSHYQSVELGLLVRFYSVAFAPGALVVMLVESVVTVLFLFLCFQSYIAQLITGATPSDVGGGGHAKGHAKSDGSDGIPDGMEFLRFAESPALFVFLFLLSYVSAGVVEESLKYYCARDVKRRRPSYRVLYGYGLYAAAAALGFSSIENIGYVLSGAVGKGGDGSVIGVLVNVLGRVCISTPLHVMCGYLIGLQVFRRDVLAEPLSIFRVMGWSVFFHGTFDFGLFCIMVLQRHWSSGPDDNAVSYVLMACVVVNVMAGLVYTIWRTRQHILNRVAAPLQVQHAEEEHEGAGLVQPHSPLDEEAGGAGHAHAQPSANGFARLQQQDADEAEQRSAVAAAAV